MRANVAGSDWKVRLGYVLSDMSQVVQILELRHVHEGLKGPRPNNASVGELDQSA